MAFVVGLLCLIAISIIARYPDPIVLSGTFNGWIAAITGFYFLQQTADKVQQQAKLAYEEEDGRKRGTISKDNEEMKELRIMFYDVMNSLQADINEREKIIENLLKELKQYAESDEKMEADNNDDRTA